MACPDFTLSGVGPHQGGAVWGGCAWTASQGCSAPASSQAPGPITPFS